MIDTFSAITHLNSHETVPLMPNKNSEQKLTIFYFILQVCDMVFKVNGIPEKYITLGIELPRGCDTCTGSEYRGSKSLVEYIVGDSVMDLATNGTDLYGVARVVTIFKGLFHEIDSEKVEHNYVNRRPAEYL